MQQHEEVTVSPDNYTWSNFYFITEISQKNSFHIYMQHCQTLHAICLYKWELIISIITIT